VDQILETFVEYLPRPRQLASPSQPPLPTIMLAKVLSFYAGADIPGIIVRMATITPGTRDGGNSPHGIMPTGSRITGCTDTAAGF
jgi:hypothetical protein